MLFNLIEKGKFKEFRKLLPNSDINEVNSSNWTFLYAAVFYEKIDFIIYLIKKNVNVSIRTIHKYSVLDNILQMFLFNRKIVKYLYKKDVDIQIYRNFSHTHHISIYNEYYKQFIKYNMNLCMTKYSKNIHYNNRFSVIIKMIDIVLQALI